jgi:hypothetical protein
MIRNIAERMAKEIGFDLGCSDDKTQAELFNAFANGLNTSCKGNASMQLYYMSKGLTIEAIEMLRELCEYRALQEAKEK